MATNTMIQTMNTSPEEGQALVQANSLLPKVFDLLEKIRGVRRELIEAELPSQSIPNDLSTIADTLPLVSSALIRISKQREAGAIDQVWEKAVDKKAFGGLGLNKSRPATSSEYDDVIFLTEAWLESLNSQDKETNQFSTIDIQSEKTKPMNLAQKIFAHHTIGGCAIEGLAIGDVVRVGVDWVIASELSWSVSWHMRLRSLKTPVNATIGHGKGTCRTRLSRDMAQ
jgi:hypothetical protein